MILFKKAIDLRKHLDVQRKSGKKIGFVPTMGALHEGHLSLIQASKSATTLTVCSIFVNPTQFNDPADFEKYPLSTDKDIALLLSAGCDLLFLPDVDEMYPDGLTSNQKFDLGEMETLLEGKFRPGHFQGVCQVVNQLLLQVEPDALFMGQKDYQQCMVINRLLQQTGNCEKIQLHICPTLREPDGLAMSSRNRRLNEADRVISVTIYRTLSFLKENLKAGKLDVIQKSAFDQLQAAGFRTDYIVIADATTLQPVTYWDGKQQLVALVAAFLGEVRLIDNLPLN
ncbi:MAG TPA: pantoate--beta-alanine ligase [Chitinophagaceae bacterium]|nr:pantoate--beta-alanine ligase [Chitinophagaceae bacterium]HPH30857.1 pantoate--beta-alanine ligase [Chitinophagaceae bacterium]HPN58866.1 pantoate--beta-alanine ligase [Chitinophagaceae bacterium]